MNDQAYNPDESLDLTVNPSPSKSDVKASVIEARRQKLHASIAQANLEKTNLFNKVSLDKKLILDRPQALNEIEVDTTSINMFDFAKTPLADLTPAEKMDVWVRNKSAKVDAEGTATLNKAINDRDRTVGEVVGDSATALLATGAVGLGQAAYGLADVASRMNPISQIAKNVFDTDLSLDRGVRALGLPGAEGFNKTREAINETLMSDPAKYQKAAVQADAASRQAGKAERLAAAAVNGKNTWWDLAKEEGGSFNAGLKSLANNPIELANITLESGLMMFVPGAIANKAREGLVKGMSVAEASTFLASKAGQEAAEKLGTRIGYSTTAVLEGMSNAVESKGAVLAMDEAELRSKSPLYAKLLEQGLSPEEARMQVSENVFDSVAFVAGTIGGLTSKFSGAAKLEGNLFKSSAGNAAVNTVTGATKEGIEETTQSIGGQFAQNQATQEYVDPTQDLTENLGAAGASGLAAGSLSGGIVTGVTSAAGVASEKATEALVKRGKAKEVDTKISSAINKGVETGDYSELSALSEEDKEKALAQMVNSETLSNPKLQMDREALTKHLDAGREILLARNNKLKVKAEASATKLDELNAAKVDPTSAEYLAAQTEATKDKEALDKATAELKTFVGIRKASKIESGTLKEAIFQVSRDAQLTDPETKTTLTNIIRNMGSSIDSFDDSDLEAIAQLPNKQASELAKSALDLRTVMTDLQSSLDFKTSDDVNVDMTTGSEKWRGIQDKLTSFKEALATDNKTRATAILNNMRSLVERNQREINNYKPLGLETPKQIAYIGNLRREKPMLIAATKYFQKAHAASFGPGILSTEAVVDTVDAVNKPTEPKTTEAGEKAKQFVKNNLEDYKAKGRNSNTKIEIVYDKEGNLLKTYNKDLSNVDYLVYQNIDPRTKRPFEKRYLVRVKDNQILHVFKNPKIPLDKELIKTLITKSLTAGDVEVQTKPVENAKETTKPAPVKSKAESFANHSGGAKGSDTAWGTIGAAFGVTKQNHYYHGNKTPTGNIKITEEQYQEGLVKAKAAAKAIGRNWSNKPFVQSLLSRNWQQVKNADAVFAIVEGFDGPHVKGGTGYAVAMAIAENKPVYVFSQGIGKWYKAERGGWVEVDTPTLTPNFAGIGTRELNQAGKDAIESVYAKTFTEPATSSEATTATKTVADTAIAEELENTLLGLTGQVRLNNKTLKKLDEIQKFFNDNYPASKAHIVRIKLDAYKQGMVDAYNNTMDESNTNRDYQNGVQFIFKNGVAYNTVSDIKRKSIKRMAKDGKQVSRLATYVTQAKTSLVKNPNLQLVPDLRTKINAELKSDEFSILNELDDDEILTMESVDYFLNKFLKSFDQIVKIGKNNKEGVFSIFDTELEFNYALDLVTETINEDGSITYSLPDNLKTAIGVTLFNWLTSAPEASSKYNSDARINAALGREKDAEVSQEARELLQEAGVYANNLETTLGEEALSLIGAKVNPEASAEYKAKLTNAIGKWALNIAAYNGFVEYNYVDLVKMMALNNQIPAKSDFGQITPFVRPVFKQGQLGTEHDTFIAQMYNTPNVLTKVFGLEPGIKVPTFEPTQAVRYEVSNSDQKAPKGVAEARFAYEQKPYVVKKGMLSLITNLSDGFIARAAGSVTASELEEMHVTERAKALVNNQEIARRMRISLPFMKKSFDKVFYFGHDIWTNMRMGMNTTINMQSNKFDRWLFANENWAVTVQTEAQRDVFKQAVASLFGEKIEEKTNTQIRRWFENKLKEPVIVNALEAIKTLKSGNFDDTQRRELETAVYLAVKNGGEKMGTLAALEALTEYNDTKPFNTDLAIEIDGKTNGFIFSLIQYSGAKSLPELQKFLERGGIFFNSLQNLSDWIQNPTIGGRNLDSYQVIAKSWGIWKDQWFAHLNGKNVDLGILGTEQEEDNLGAAKDTLNKLSNKGFNLSTLLSATAVIVGSFTDAAGEVTKIARELAKDPLMTTNYGAGIDTIIENFGNKVIKVFYQNITKQTAAYNEGKRTGNQEKMQNAQAELARLNSAMETVLGTKLNITVNNAKEFTLNKDQIAHFTSLLTATYGMALRGAIRENFDSMLTNRRKISKPLQIASEMYAVAFSVKKEKQLVENNGAPLTEAQFKKIKDELIELFPTIASYFSDRSDTSRKDHMQIGTFDRVFDKKYEQKAVDTELDEEYNPDDKTVVSVKKRTDVNNQVKVQFNFKIKRGEGVETASATSYVEIPQNAYTGIGSRGPALTIQSMDAAAMALTLMKYQVMNNHDAIMVSIADANEATKAINQNFFDVSSNFSFVSEAIETLNRVTAAFYKLKDIPTEAKSELVNKATKAINALYDPVIASEQGKPASLSIEEGRKEILSQITAVNQYTMNDAAHTTKPVENKEATEYEIEQMIDSMYSAPGNMTGFNETKSRLVDTVNVAVGVLDQLQASDVAPTTPAHMDQLRTLMAKFGSVLKPLYLAIDDTKDKTLGRYFEGKKRIEIQLNRTTPVGILRGMSAAETFAHEMAHSFVKTAMDKQTRYTKKLKYLYDLAKTNVKPSDLIERDAAGNVIANPTPEQVAAGQATWDYLFGNPNVRKERVFNSATNMYEYVNSNDMFQEFIAYTMTNKQLQDVLANNTTLNAAWKKGEPKQRTETAAQSGIFKKIDSWLGQFLDYVNDLITGFEFQIYGLKNVTADVGAMDLIYRAVNIQANHSSKVMNSLEKFADVNTQVIDAVSAWVVQPIAKWLSKGPKDGVVKNVATIITALPENSAEGLNKAMDKLISRAKISEDSMLLKLYREAQGATTKTAKFHILLRMSNTYIDRMRKNVAGDVKRMLNNQFSRTLEKAEKSALTRVLLKTDIAVIMQSAENPNGYTLDQLKSLLTNKSFLLKEIENLNKQITLAEYGRNTHFYTKQAASLGNFLATGVHTEKAGGLNAYSIANMVTTAGFGKKQGDITKAEAIIDKLATLHAIKNTNALDTSIVAKLIDSEATGVDFVIQTQAYMRKDARNRLFKKTPIQMVKGYTREILNPNVDVIVRPIGEAKLLATQGYTFVRRLPKDAMDPAPEMAQFVQRHKKMNSLLAGIVSYTSKGSKGTDLIASYQNQLGPDNPAAFGRAVTDAGHVKSQLHKHMQDLFSSKMTATTEVNLVPIVNEKGFTAGYRYIMTEATKQKLMDKQDSFDDVIGLTLANVQDKLNSQIINQKLVETAKEDFDQYGVSEGSEFIAFGPGIGTKEDQELYNLMPDDMKKSIKQVWGSNTMYIRKRNMDIIFGYRRKSAADFVPNFKNKVLNSAAQSVIKQLNRPGVRMVENAWQEVVTMAKDAIVIKTGTVLAYNILSNTVLLKLAGVPALDILKHHKTAFTATDKYQREQHELNQLKLEVGINKKLSADQLKTKKSRIAFLENELSTSPVHELIRAGIYQTIVEDLSDEDDSFTYASELEEKTEKFTKYIPQVVKDAGKLVAIGHDTRLYKALRNTTQMSDFVARYTLHQHNLKNGMSGPESIAQIMRTFIDYDPPTHPTIEYANSMGLIMFTKYFVRIQRVLIELGIKKPGNILMLMLFQGMSGIDIEDPYQAVALDVDNITSKLNDPGNVVDAIVSNNLFTLGGL